MINIFEQIYWLLVGSLDGIFAGVLGYFCMYWFDREALERDTLVEKVFRGVVAVFAGLILSGIAGWVTKEYFQIETSKDIGLLFAFIGGWMNVNLPNNVLEIFNKIFIVFLDKFSSTGFNKDSWKIKSKTSPKRPNKSIAEEDFEEDK